MKNEEMCKSKCMQLPLPSRMIMLKHNNKKKKKSRILILLLKIYIYKGGSLTTKKSNIVFEVFRQSKPVYRELCRGLWLRMYAFIHGIIALRMFDRSHEPLKDGLTLCQTLQQGDERDQLVN